MEKVAELYQAGYSPYVKISSAIKSIYPQSTEFAFEHGIPKETIIEEHDMTSTHTMLQNHEKL